MPLYCAGLWLAVNIAAGASRLPAAKYTRSVETSPRSTTSLPARRTPSMNASTSGSDDGRASRPTRTWCAPVNATNALPTNRATDSSIWSGYTPRMS